MIGGSLEDYVEYSLFTLEPHSGSPFEAFSSGGLAVFLVAAFILAGRRRGLRTFMAPPAVVGAMALTAYAARIIVLAYVPNDGSSNLYAGLLTLGLIGVCAAWRALFTAGPLENLVGALSDRSATTADKYPAIRAFRHVDDAEVTEP